MEDIKLLGTSMARVKIAATGGQYTIHNNYTLCIKVEIINAFGP